MSTRCRTALAVLVAAFAFSAVAASAAIAAPEWYSSSTKPAPEWWQGGSKLSSAINVKTSGKVWMEDRGAPMAVSCESSGEGTAGTGAAGKLTSWTLSGCAPTAKAINEKGEEVANACLSVTKTSLFKKLPWRGTLTLSKGTLQDVLIGEGKEELGFQFECNTSLGKVADECSATEKQISVPVSNVSGGVEATFGSEPLYKCSVSNKKAGVMRSSQRIEAVSGGALETHIVEGAYSKLTSSIGVKATGTITMEDKVLGEGFSCQMEYNGTIGSGGKGTITSGSATSCHGVGECASVKELTAVGYPWATQLSATGEVISDKIVSGLETPGYLFECSGGHPDTCNMTVSPQLTNGLEGDVFARFGEAITSCSSGGKEKGVVEGELTIAPETGAIEAK